MGRRVAVKLLSSGDADPERQARLEDEARVNGALPHPNVVAAFDIGRHQGHPFIVTEFLQGTTLRARLQQGPLPPDVALDYVRQLARGLSAAHERRVVHCDIKPDNLFITQDGWLKILDFGIARLDVPDPTDSEEDPSAPPVRAFAGTSGYAPPEQLDGGEPDPRWDVFACGAVAYEMLSGRRAFPGATREQRREAARKAAPPPLGPAAPLRLRRAIERCLTKDPALRFPSAPALAVELEKVGKPVRPWLRTALLVAGVAALAAGAAYFSRPARGGEASFRQVTFHPGAVWTARFSADGQRTWYTESWDGSPARVFSTGLDQRQLQRLEIDRAVLAGVSSSGEVAVLARPHFDAFDYTGTLSVVPAPGGAERELLSGVEYADWAPSGSLAVVRHEGSHARLEFPAGHVLVETLGWLSHPRVSPKGDLIAFIDHPRISESHGSLAVVDLAGKRTEVAQGLHTAEGLAWSPSGDELWFSAALGEHDQQPALRAVTLSGAQRLLARAPGNLKLQDVARDGRVLVTQPQNYLGLALADLRGAERDLSWLDQPILYDITPDGSTLLFTVALAAGRVGPLYVRNTDGSAPVRIAEGRTGALSADGRFVAAVSAEGEEQPILIIPTGPGETRTLPPSGLTALRARFFPDGRRLLIAAEEKGKGVRLYVQKLEGGAPVPISAEGIAFRFFAISPDGKTIAAQEADGSTVLLDPDGAAPRKPAPGVLTSEVPYCFLDAQTLLAGAFLELPARIFAVDVKSGERRPWTTITPRAPGAYGIGRILSANDGKVLAYNYLSAKTHLYLLEGVR